MSGEVAKDLAGKIVVVTGATSGIGQRTALMLAERGAEVIAIGRDAKRGAETQAALERASGGKGSFLGADLSLVGESRRVVAELGRRLDGIDALILSAGVINFAAEITSEGLDKMFAINFLHKVVLAEGLLPLLARRKGRLVVVAADIPDRLGIDWKNFEGARSYSGVLAMAQLHGVSLALVQSLARDWQREGVEVTAIHPGQVDTDVYRSFVRFPWTLVRRFMRLFLVSVEKPATLLSWLAFSAEAKGASGHIFPSVRNQTKRRPLRRDSPSVERVLKTAHELLATR